MNKMQKTISKSISISGLGIHTGSSTKVTLKPADENTGIRFIRIDLKGKPEIKADVSNVFSTARSTSLRKENAEIHTVEHILAAITGASIDNIIIETNNIEIPILDGSSKIYSELIDKVGIVIQNSKKEYFEITKKISFIDEETGSSIVAVPSEKYKVNIDID